MPKDWLRYKAEIHRLYIVEDKTVYDVRETLKRRHTFSASVRAYRMKFDEWGMRKYKSQKSRSNTGSSNQTHFSPPPTSGNFDPLDTSPRPTDADMGFIASESTAMEVVEAEPEPPINKVLASIDLTTAHPLEILETILQNWQPDPSFTETLKTYFQQPDFNKWISRDEDQPEILSLINKYVQGRDNQFNLIKTLLEADLSCRRQGDDPITAWQESWYTAAVHTTDWEKARDILDDKDHNLYQSSPVFLECALVVIAELFLEKCTQRLTVSMNNLFDSQKEKYIKEYREILRSFHQAKDDVCPRFYRDFLTLDFTDRSEGTRTGRAYEEEYRQKYILLSCLRPKRECGKKHDDGEKLMDMSWFFGDTNQSTTNNLPPTPPTPTGSKRRPFTITTAKALDILIKVWHDLSGFEEYTHSLFLRDGTFPLSIFTTPSPSDESENIFDAIISRVALPADQISLAKALLVTSTTFLLPTNRETPRPWLLTWWQTIYPCSPSTSPPITFDRFQSNLLCNPTLNQEIAKVAQTEEGRKLVLDAAASLVGERLLGVLKLVMGRMRMRNDSMGWMSTHTEYNRVIGMIEKRGIVVDRTWSDCIL